jgi:STE20-like kinase
MFSCSSPESLVIHDYVNITLQSRSARKMSFLNNLKKVFHLGSGEAKKKRLYNNIRMDTDPADIWDMIGELGDGAFGKVYKAQNKETGKLAAAKMCTLEDEENLSDHMVEIDILSEIRHLNIVELFEAFSIDDKLWVRPLLDSLHRKSQCSP